MNSTNHRRYAPIFQGRTRDAIVTSMVGNVIGVKMMRRKRRPALQSTAVLGTKVRAN